MGMAGWRRVAAVGQKLRIIPATACAPSCVMAKALARRLLRSTVKGAPCGARTHEELRRFQERLAGLQQGAAGQGPVRGGGHHAADGPGRIHRHRRPFGLRQEHLHEADHGPEHAQQRQHPHRRPAGDRAAEDQRHGLPGAQPAALAHDAGQRAAAAGDRRALPLELQSQARRIRGQGAQAAAKRGPGRLRGQVPVAAVGRHAAARQHLPRAGARAEDAAAGRALRRARRLHARGAVVRDARPAGGAEVQRHPGHARPARKRVPGRHGVRDEQEPGAHRRQARDRPAAPARPGDHLHPAVHRHRARAAWAHRRDAQNPWARFQQRESRNEQEPGALRATHPAGGHAGDLAVHLQRLQRQRVHLPEPLAHRRSDLGTPLDRSWAMPGAPIG